jgi:ABC-type enterochelin transport system permease subunit
MDKIKDYISTIALIAAYLALEVSLYSQGQYELTGVLVAILISVIVGEVVSIKNTGKTISKRFGQNSDNVKYTMSVIFALWAVSLLVHLNI